VSESYRSIVDAAMQQESNAWISDKYSGGSLSISEVKPVVEVAGMIRLRGTFKFNGGLEGFFGADFNDARLKCIDYNGPGHITAFNASGGEFDPGYCHTPMTVEQTRSAAAFIRRRDAEIQREALETLADWMKHLPHASAERGDNQSKCTAQNFIDAPAMGGVLGGLWLGSGCR
jgi:hypothetical protein